MRECGTSIHDNCSCLCVEVCQVQQGSKGTIISCGVASNVLKVWPRCGHP
jgi:hypothetical protein